jgi:hypothetical protein
MPEHIRRRIALAAAVVVGLVSAVAIGLQTRSWIAAAITVLATLLAGAVSLAITPVPAAAASAGPATAVTGAVPGPASAVAAAGAAGPGEAVAVRERAALVAASLYLRDRLTSVALTDRLDRELAAVGVLPVAPVGERFDPSRHTAEGAVPTGDPQLAGVIATVEAPGWADRGVLLRPPAVTVYQPAAGQST